MVKTRRAVVFLTVAGAISTMATSSYAQLEARCTLDDALNTPNAIGRNAWARKCGYLSQAAETFYNSEGEYRVFQNACNTYPNVPPGSTCTQKAPVQESAACVQNLVILGTCMAGCYTPTQEVAFEGSLVGIEAAYSQGASTVSALTQDSTKEALFFQEQPIRSFVAGETRESILLLEALDGRHLEVTAEHPMVNWLGDVVKAHTLMAGDLLLGDDGNLIELTSVSQFQYQGLVWNVKPLSKNKMENILNASGFLSGSVRFQNEWAEESHRLATRDTLDVGGL
ncbi:hypothetical protein [Chondromyces apiculatus]|nr:hypothetical protein [Chondromyces apiculatus]